MSQSESWTVGRLLEWTSDFLRRRGTENPRLDAEILLAESLGCRRIELYTSFNDVVDEGPRAMFRELLRRRAAGTPVAYLVGRREFYSLSFKVTPDVLIPRPESEFLIVALLDWVAKDGGKGDTAAGEAAEETPAKPPAAAAPLQICDIGTGSGVLAVTAAVHLPEAELTAVDICPKALQVARQNARLHNVENRIEFIHSDLFESLPAERRFDYILSNPPYVSEAEMNALARDVGEHEPRGALLAGRRGDEVIRRLLPQAAERLSPGGRLLMEISPMIHDTVLALIAATPGLQAGETLKDLARLPRVAQAQKC